MVSMARSSKALALSLDSLVPSRAARVQTLSVTSNRVRRISLIAPLFVLSRKGSVGLVTRFGQFYKSVDPGLVQVNVCTESVRIVDVKIQISPIGRQTVITRDNVNVEMCVCRPSWLFRMSVLILHTATR